MTDGQRHTIVEETALSADPIVLAEREAANAIAQFDAVLEMIEDVVRRPGPFRLRLSQILDLHRVAMEGVHALAGTFRNSPVGIGGSSHTPPREYLVANLVEEMCDWVTAHWADPAIRLCAYVMWRLNWIHPFADGNGRTSRAVAYLVLCARSGFSLPGRKTIPEQIAEDRTLYYAALESIDASPDPSDPDLAPMEALLSACLKEQLDSAFAAATLTGFDDSVDRKFH